MNFYRLRFMNTLFLFLLGIALGYLLKKVIDIPAYTKNTYKPVYSSSLSYTPRENWSAHQSSKSVAVENDNNPMDDDEEYILPVMEQADGKTSETPPSGIDEILARPEDSMADFVKNPELYSGKDVSGKVQMIIAKKLESGWRLNFLYWIDDKDLTYLYVDDPDNVSGDKSDFKVGYFYYIKFRCGSGDLKKDNKLLSIYPTGEKTPWASGVSAVE